MIIPVVMPQMGESVAEGTVVRWFKRAGERVALDEPLFEISTDKVDTDVPAPAAGTLQTILVAAGQTVDVGMRVAVIDDGVAAGAVGDQAREARQSGTPAERADGPAPHADEPGDGRAAAHDVDEPAAHFKNAHAPQLVSFRREPTRTAPSPAPPPAARTFSPAVLDSARRGHVPLDTLTALTGSGRGGRVTKGDIARFLESGASAVAPRAARGTRDDADGPPAQTAFEPPREYLYRPSADDRVQPMSPVRRKIADHMTWSVRISPHASAFAECDVSLVVDLVRRERDAFNARVGAPLTFTVIAASALARTVREFPVFNASVVGDSIVIKPRVHVGIAVALPDTGDLIVPVVRDADGLSMAGMARAVLDLATRAREHRLQPDEVRGGTITLTNPGMFGGLTGTPILNQPQVAILGLGAIVRRAVVLDDDRIAPRSMMTVALTFDHRAADGMAAFTFLDRLKARLETDPGEV
jgi:pyruvate dehydrogenase E2 component (dihydrolipoyllysine-residue acetyltransferase)